MKTLSLCGLLATVAAAQSDHLTAHPQDRSHVNTGQVVPFSCDASRCESRSQLLVDARYLPGPGAVLVGVEFSALIGGVVTYDSLQLTVSPVAPGAIRSSQFAANLPNPTTVLQLANHTMFWPLNTWTRFTFSQPYVHDGVSSLTLDIQKDAAPCLAGGSMTGLHRPDLPTMLVAFGGSGSGQNLAAVAMWSVIPIDMRLVWSGAPTARLSSPIPGAMHHGFAVGSSLDHVVDATAGDLVGLIGDLQWSAPVTLPFASGQLWVAGVALGIDVVGAGGEARTSFAIPPSPAFVGQQVAFQPLILELATGQLRFANAVDCYVGQ